MPFRKLVSLLVLGPWAVLFGRSMDLPTVTIDYSSLFDNSCSESLKQPLDSALVARVEAKLPAYRAQWMARGPALLRAEVAVGGQPFEFHETRRQSSRVGCRPSAFH
jgi:hypothetical protein